MNKSAGNFKPKSNIPAFLLKTYDILENTAHSDTISWNKEGTAFIVYSVNEFAEKILPKYFKHNNFSSFVRQLNMYDFHKSKQDGKENEFKHKLFKRGQKHLLADIKRKGSETQSFMDEQVMNGDMQKAKKNGVLLNDELTSVKIQQEELGKVGKMIYAQNTQLLNENKLLWNELTKNKEKYEKKIEKLMMFVYSVAGQSGKDALGALPDKKMLPFSESTDALQPNQQITPVISPDSQQKENFLFTPPNKKDGSSPSNQDKKSEEQFGAASDQAEAKAKSPAMYGTPTSNVSTVPNTPNMGPMVAPPTLFSFGNSQPLSNVVYPLNMQANTAVPIHNIYNAQPYLSETTNLSPTAQMNATKENVKPNARLAPTMSPADAAEFKENPTKALKKEAEGYAQVQNPLQVWNLPSFSGMNDSFKLDEYPVPLNLSRGPSYNNADLGFSRFNSFNVPRIPNSLEANFAQWPMYIQNLQSNGENYGLNINKFESEGMPKFDMVGEDGLPCFSPGTFLRTPNGLSAYTFGQTCEDPLYRNKH